MKFLLFIAVLLTSPAAFCGGVGSGSGLDMVSVPGALVGGGGPGLDHLTHEGMTISSTPTPPPGPGPDSIAGCTCFWNFANPATITLNSGAVASILDTVGGNTMTQGDGGSQPAFVASGGIHGGSFANFSGAAFLGSASFGRFGSATGLASIAVRVKVPPQDDGSIFGFKDSADDPIFYFLTGDLPSNGGKLLTRIAAGSFGQSTLSNSNIFVSTPVWSTIVFTFDPDVGTKLYLNSTTPDGAATTPFPVILGAESPAQIGARDTPPLGLLNGSIEYVATYNQALTPEDIAILLAY